MLDGDRAVPLTFDSPELDAFYVSVDSNFGFNDNHVTEDV